MSDILYILKAGETIESSAALFTEEDILPISFDDDIETLISEGGPCRAVTKQFEYSDELMGERYVSLTISSPTPIEWALGDWCCVKGETMQLRYVPTGKKQGRKNAYGAAYVYENIKFTSLTGDLSTREMMDYTTGDTQKYYTGTGKFTFYVSSLWDLALRIQANLDVNFPEQWLIEVKGGGEDWKDQNVSVSEGTTILSCLAYANSMFNQNYYIRRRSAGDVIYPNSVIAERYVGTVLEANGDGSYTLLEDFNVITIGGSTESMQSTLCYGIGKGLRSLEAQTDPSAVALTRLRAYGSTKNMPYRYYNRHYRKRNNDGSYIYEQFWDDGVYLLDTVYFPNLMLPMAYWNRVENTNYFNIYVDAISANYEKAGIENADAPEELEEDEIFEGQKTFDTDDVDYDECYPTLEEMTIDDTWVGNHAYMSGYTTQENLGYRPSVTNLIAYCLNNYVTSSRVAGESGWNYGPELVSYPTGLKGSGGVIPDYQWTLDFLSYYDNHTDSETMYDYFDRKYESLVDTFREEEASYVLRQVKRNSSGVMTVDMSERYPITYKIYVEITLSKDIKGTNAGGSCFLPKGTYRYEYESKVTFDWEKLKVDLEAGYVDDDGYMDETTQYMHTITAEDVANITSNTYNESGRLDRITGGSIKTHSADDGDDGDPLVDNGVQDDDTSGSNGLDTKGEVIEETCQIMIPQVCFDIEDWVNDSPTICMKSGMCAGREFEIGACVAVDTSDFTKGWRLTLNRYRDTEVNMWFPNANFPISEGDEYVITGINMPDVYVEAAEQKLFKNAMKYLYDTKDTAKTYNIELDNKWLAENYVKYTKNLFAGKKFLFNDYDYNRRTEEWNKQGDLGLYDVAVVIKQVQISFGSSPLPQYQIALDNDAEPVTLNSVINAKVKNANEEVTSSVNDITSTVSSLAKAVSSIESNINEDFDDFKNGIKKLGKLAGLDEVTFDSLPNLFWANIDVTEEANSYTSPKFQTAEFANSDVSGWLSQIAYNSLTFANSTDDGSSQYGFLRWDSNAFWFGVNMDGGTKQPLLMWHNTSVIDNCVQAYGLKSFEDGNVSIGTNDHDYLLNVNGSSWLAGDIVFSDENLEHFIKCPGGGISVRFSDCDIAIVDNTLGSVPIDAFLFDYTGEGSTPLFHIEFPLVVGEQMGDDAYIRIGDAFIKYDSENKALYVADSEGNAMNFYATGGVAAYGYTEGSSPSGASALKDLTDVSIPTSMTSEYDGYALAWDATQSKWTAQKISSGSGSGSNVYWSQVVTSGKHIASIRIDDVTTQIYVPDTLAWDNITGTPTTLAGYGITDALTASDLTPYLLKTDAATTYQPMLTSAQQSAVDSGIYAALVTDINSHLSDTDIHITSDERDAWDAKWDWNESEIKSVKVNNATTADKLGTATVGGAITPIYIKAGKATACAMAKSGDFWGVLPQISADGVMEVGAYIDFHYPDGNTDDYLGRISCTTYGQMMINTMLSVNGGGTSGYGLGVNGNSYFTSYMGIGSVPNTTDMLYVDGITHTSNYFNAGNDDVNSTLKSSALQMYENNALVMQLSKSAMILKGTDEGARYIDFYGDEEATETITLRLIETSSALGTLEIVSGYTDPALKIGGAVLHYDKTNKALYVDDGEGGGCSFYATGGVAAYSNLSSGAGDANLANLTLTNKLTAASAALTSATVKEATIDSIISGGVKITGDVDDSGAKYLSVSNVAYTNLAGSLAMTGSVSTDNVSTNSISFKNGNKATITDVGVSTSAGSVDTTTYYMVVEIDNAKYRFEGRKVS